jgi:cation diffusion facilitator CzcD-associated flavoprotein CzcO
MTQENPTPEPNQYRTDYDVVVVGAGFSGLYALHRLRDDMGLSVRVIDLADDVGGTWYHNQYPGAQCDSESHVYQYTFDEEILEEWTFSKKYPSQPEMYEYFQHVADKLDLRKDITFNTRVTSAEYDGEAGTWDVETDKGERISTQFLISAVGALSDPVIPDFDNVDAFEGQTFHPARYPKDGVEYEGKRVAVIGTGSTGIQISPQIADRDVEDLTVFQRTPNYAIPAQNEPRDEDDWKEIKNNYDDILEKSENSGTGYPFEPVRETAADLSMEEVRDILDDRWEKGGFRFNVAFEDLIVTKDTAEKVSEYIRERIREQLDDPELREKLVPDDHYYGTKRPPLEEGYFEMFNRGDASLVDVTETPIERFTEDGIQTSAEHFDFDIVVFATGFDAFTGSITKMNIQGRNGLTIEEKWDDGPTTYLGVAAHNFPNLFMVTGPQSPSVLGNMPTTIEHTVEWITDAIEHVRDSEASVIEATKEAEEAWNEHNREVAENTLYNTVDSWYRNSNIPGQPTVFVPYIGGYSNYHDLLDESATKDYTGFQLTDPENAGITGSVPSLSVMEGD